MKVPFVISGGGPQSTEKSHKGLYVRMYVHLVADIHRQLCLQNDCLRLMQSSDHSQGDSPQGSNCGIYTTLIHPRYNMVATATWYNIFHGCWSLTHTGRKFSTPIPTQRAESIIFWVWPKLIASITQISGNGTHYSCRENCSAIVNVSRMSTINLYAKGKKVVPLPMYITLVLKFSIIDWDAMHVPAYKFAVLSTS